VDLYLANRPCWADDPTGPTVSSRLEARINFYIFIFSINFVFLIKNIFNIIKFELKIYDFTLNNIIKIVYIIFLSHVCRAGQIGPTIGPSRARPNGSCHAWHNEPEVRPGHGPVWASGHHGPQSFMLGRARAGPIPSCFRPVHLAQLGWPGICGSEVIAFFPMIHFPVSLPS
jgi:hypothetical protein